MEEGESEQTGSALGDSENGCSKYFFWEVIAKLSFGLASCVAGSPDVLMKSGYFIDFIKIPDLWPVVVTITWQTSANAGPGVLRTLAHVSR